MRIEAIASGVWAMVCVAIALAYLALPAIPAGHVQASNHGKHRWNLSPCPSFTTCRVEI